MILPSKHLSQDRALLTVGARILQKLSQPKTVSALWEELKSKSETTRNRGVVSQLRRISSWHWTFYSLSGLLNFGRGS